MRPRIDSSKIQANTCLSIGFDFSLKLFHYGVKLPISFVTLCDVRQLLSVINEISIASSSLISEDISTNLDDASHIAFAQSHLLQVIENMYDPEFDNDLVPGADVSRLQFVLYQELIIMFPIFRS